MSDFTKLGARNMQPQQQQQTQNDYEEAFREAIKGLVPPPKKGGDTKHKCKSREEFYKYVDMYCNGEISIWKASKAVGMNSGTFRKWMLQLVFNQIEPPDYLFENNGK